MIRWTLIVVFLVSSTSWGPEVVALDEAESLALLVRTIGEMDSPAIQATLLRGMLEGLAGRRNVVAPKQWETVGQTLNASRSNDVRDLALQLAHIFGDPEATKRAIATATDVSTNPASRRTVLQSLLTAKDGELSKLLPELLSDTELQIDAIRGFAAFENPAASSLLLQRYGDANPQAKKAIIETLASRKVYADALLTAMKKDQISRDDVPVHVARSLESLLGRAFTDVYGSIREMQPDREKLIAKYKEMLTPDVIAAGDARRGRAVFQRTCAACHLLYATGGNIGPDLTGSNRANLDYLLLNSVDPSYDVPDGYQMVLIQTVDGRLLSGVVAEEDTQRVVLKTVEQPSMVVLQEDIEARKRSPKSMMPDGQLEQLKRNELVDLIKYLQTTKQVELPE